MRPKYRRKPKLCHIFICVLLVLSDERLGAKLRVTENRRVIFNRSTYVYIYIYIFGKFLAQLYVSADHGCILLDLALQILPFTQAFTLSNGLVRATSQLYGSASKWSSLIHHSWFILVLLSESVCRVWAKSFIRHLVS